MQLRGRAKSEDRIFVETCSRVIDYFIDATNSTYSGCYTLYVRLFGSDERKTFTLIVRQA
jgi:hypothetical protein